MKQIKQNGFTLIELMVSITIGIFIIGAAMYVLQGTSGINRQVSEVTQLRQQAAFGLRTIARQVREAGSVEPTWSTDTLSFKFDKTYAWAGGSPLSAWVPPSGSLPDSLSVSLQVPSLGNTYTRNCLGQSIASGNVSRFYVKDSNLRCQTGISQDQPILENVNGFTVRYRISDGSGKRFVPNASIANWNKVDAIELCLDLVGGTVSPTNGQTYVDCSGATVSRGNRLHVIERTLIGVHAGRV